MPRPRLHDLDELLDAAESLAAHAGPSAVTVRALSEVTGVSNGAIYHAFGSRAGLVAQVWLRAAQRFLTLQNDAVEQALAADAEPRHAAIHAVVAAADAPAAFAQAHEVAGRFLLTVDRAELIGSGGLADDLASQLRTLDATLTALFVRLADAMWRRTDRAAVAVIRDCVVELPTALLLRGRRAPTDDVRARLAAAMRAVVSIPPPEPDAPPSKGPR